jgi:hypothetical protein
LAIRILCEKEARGGGINTVIGMVPSRRALAEEVDKRRAFGEFETGLGKH